MALYLRIDIVCPRRDYVEDAISMLKMHLLMSKMRDLCQRYNYLLKMLISMSKMRDPCQGYNDLCWRCLCLCRRCLIYVEDAMIYVENAFIHQKEATQRQYTPCGDRDWVKLQGEKPIGQVHPVWWACLRKLQGEKTIDEDAVLLGEVAVLISEMLNLCWSCDICVSEMYRADKEQCIWRRLECLRLCGVVHCVQLVWRFNTLHSTGSLRNEPRGLVSCVRDMWFSKLHDEEPERASELVWFSKPNVCRRACQLVNCVPENMGHKRKTMWFSKPGA